ncbi:MAG: Hpt domain-containing protein [Bacteroidales bacterium]|nr:Hpt domain-containing protein [Bacteroidales bacterium]
MIDKEVFRSVFADFDAEIIHQIINIYISEHPVKFNALKESLEQKDFNNLRNIAHGLKGVLSQFFAEEARQLAKELEFYARELNEHYTANSAIGVDEAHFIRLTDMIENLRLASLRVIEDLKEIGSEYN